MFLQWILFTNFENDVDTFQHENSSKIKKIMEIDST